MLLKSRCRQVLRPCICYHFVGSALHKLDDAIFDELVIEMLTHINVSRPLSVIWVLCHRDNCTRVLTQVHRPQLRESKFTHDDTQVQKLLTSLTGGIPRIVQKGLGEKRRRLMISTPLTCFDMFFLHEQKMSLPTPTTRIRG
jgi:hypothetical protein